MVKSRHICGFIYNLSAKKILLSRRTEVSNKIEKDCYFLPVEIEEKGNIDPLELFLNKVQKLVHLNKKQILPIFNYYDQEQKKEIFVFYSSIKQLKNFLLKDDPGYIWLPFKGINKLNIDKQTKHSLLIGQRVIDSADRKKRGEQTLE